MKCYENYIIDIFPGPVQASKIGHLHLERGVQLRDSLEELQRYARPAFQAKETECVTAQTCEKQGV